MAHLFSARPDLLLLLLGQVLDEIVEEPDVLGAGGIDPASPHAHRTVGRQFTRVTNLGTLLAILLPPILFRPPLLTVGHPFVVIAHLEHSSSFHANRTLSTQHTFPPTIRSQFFSNEGSTRATAFRFPTSFPLFLLSISLAQMFRFPRFRFLFLSFFLFLLIPFLFINISMLLLCIQVQNSFNCCEIRNP